MADNRSNLSGAAVMVTGANGFIGTHLCHRLLSEGARVTAVSRRPGTIQHDHLRAIAADFSDPGATATVIDEHKPGIIFHMAGLAAGSRDAGLVLPTFDSNLRSTVNMLTASREAGVSRVVLPGSLEEPVDASTAASSPYAMSKWAASQYGRMFHALYDLPVATARIFITYGPTAKDLHKLIPYVVLSLLAGESPKLSSGLREADWVHVDDVVDGLLAVATAPKAIGDSVDIGTGRLVSIRSVVERISVMVASKGSPHFDAVPDRPFEQERCADIARTYDRIGWRPRIDLDAGLASTVDWFRRHRERLRRP